MRILFSFGTYLLLGLGMGHAQAPASDSTQPATKGKKEPAVYVPKDSAALADSLRRAGIRKVTRHSAIVPGWGQIDNKQAWKVPIVYGALGGTAFVFFNNVKEYRGLRQAYIDRIERPTEPDLIPPRYRLLTTNSLRFFRDEFRRNVDYSVLAFIIGWGLNVVDATVFAHLRGFDVSDDLSIQLIVPPPAFPGAPLQAGIGIQHKSGPRPLKPLPDSR
jgi:hypothetical protein